MSGNVYLTVDVPTVEEPGVETITVPLDEGDILHLEAGIRLWRRDHPSTLF